MAPHRPSFWQLVCLMLHRGEPVNHARDPQLVAIRIKDVVAEATRQRVTLGSRAALAQALCMSPHYLGSEPVISVLYGRAVWCAVFSREAVLHRPLRLCASAPEVYTSFVYTHGDSHVRKDREGVRQRR